MGASIGKNNFSENQIKENFNTLIQTITKEKPVGTIWIAYSDSKKTMTKKLKLTKKRSLNVQLTAINLLNMIRLNIIETQQLSL